MIVKKNIAKKKRNVFAKVITWSTGIVEEKFKKLCIDLAPSLNKYVGSKYLELRKVFCKKGF
jgi:hypothetical protein